MKLRLYFLISLLFLVISAGAENIKQTIKPTLGEISFPTSANQAAQADFVNGVLFLHSFEYDDARISFKKAEMEDPGFALAYWGEAMTYNEPLWNQQDFSAASQVLTKLAPTDAERVEKAKTAREKGLVKALHLLFGQGDKIERDSAYADAMGELYRQYPHDDEIGMFYSLALLGKNEGERNYQYYMQAAAIAEEVSQRNPNHPGALHYAIHAYDDPIHAPLGLRAARVYSKIAPDASHALHMPSHIFLALGLWDDVIFSNKAAWEAGIKHNPEGNPKNYVIHDLHALQWLCYGYLQKQQYQSAYQLVKTIQKIAEASNTPMTKFHYALMRAAYVIESGDWNTDLKSLDMKEMEPASQASDIYTNAMIALNKVPNSPDIAGAKAELAKLNNKTTLNSVAMPGAHTDTFTQATSIGIMIATITTLELQAQLAVQQGKFEEATTLLQQATQLEDKLPIGYGPPVPIKPSHELLADVLFQNKQYRDAYSEYINELNRAPNRTLSNQGLKRVETKIKEQGLPALKETSSYFNNLMVESKTLN